MNQTTVNLLNLLVSVLITLLYTPYLVNTLGVSAYGVLPLALIINQFVAIVTGSLTGSLTRFYTIEVQNGNYNIASKYMSSVLILHSAISALLGNMVSFSNIWLSIIVKLIIPFIGSSFIAFIFIMSKDNRTEFIKLIYNK